MNIKKELEADASAITREPLTGSKKIYVPGKLHPIQVAMREIQLTPTQHTFNGNTTTSSNEPVIVYDTSGPYTDPDVSIDLKKG
ncbi:MAG TPA: phosphomethylpyrimidine synthase ThiC, partial [Bacteroidia bacterium]|nr:phosphomethylpyrimidine synthase ThiC [Bacteroidia bacterium]